MTEYGISLHASASSPIGSEETPQHIRAILDSGAKWVRSDYATWVDDNAAWVRTFHEAGLKVLLIIGHLSFTDTEAASWEQIAAKIDLILATVPDADAYEIWNEPNSPLFQKGLVDGTPASYVQLLGVASQRIRARTTAPIVGVTAAPITGMFEWVRQVMALGAGQYIDAMGAHFYGSTDQIRLQLEELLSYGRTMWTTETGKPSYAPFGFTERSQVDFANTVFPMLRDAGVEKVFWYDLMDYVEQGFFSGPEAHFGILRVDMSRKPVFTAFRDATVTFDIVPLVVGASIVLLVVVLGNLLIPTSR